MLSLARWSSVWSHLGAQSEGAHVYQALVAAYAEPHRRYHTLAHLQDCLQQFDTACTLTIQPAAVEMALWFHDAIYDTHAADNEARSAQWAREALAEAGIAGDVVQHVVDLVLVTQHQAHPVGVDACVLVDIDLSILGRSPEVFDVYESQIRAEYAWVPAATFRQRRAHILQSFLERPLIYSTPFFQERYETQARANLVRSITRLQPSHFSVAPCAGPHPDE
jgi:predicted metal-dependent HD superfamily phosphohydrolase